MRIVALDPGRTTGVAIFSSASKTGLDFHVSHLQIGPGPHHLELDEFLYGQMQKSDRDGLIIVCEGFDNRANPATELVSLEYIGVTKRFQQKYSRTVKLEIQSPSQRIWTTNAKLVAWNWLIEPAWPNRHANDGFRHLGYFLCNNRAMVPPALRMHMLRQLKGLS